MPWYRCLLLGVLAGLLGGWSQTTARHWRTDRTLWTYTVAAANPCQIRPWYRLAVTLGARPMTGDAPPVSRPRPVHPDLARASEGLLVAFSGEGGPRCPLARRAAADLAERLAAEERWIW